LNEYIYTKTCSFDASQNYLLQIDHDHIDKLIEGCKNNDRKAQELLYRNFYKVMMGLCLRYTKSEEDAKLVLNTGFFKVFKHINKFESAKATLYTWIRSIIVNSCLDHIKSKQSSVVTNELHEAEVIHIEPDISSRMNEAEILLLIKNLPPATLAVFNLYVIDGYTHNEIATLLGISEGTSKWHLSEARKNLKQQIQDKIYSE
jgi:RNA polymerase sigma factor (sigma-70 family)